MGEGEAGWGRVRRDGGGRGGMGEGEAGWGRARQDGGGRGVPPRCSQNGLNVKRRRDTHRIDPVERSFVLLLRGERLGAFMLGVCAT